MSRGARPAAVTRRALRFIRFGGRFGGRQIRKVFLLLFVQKKKDFLALVVPLETPLTHPSPQKKGRGLVVG
jgi:hypothetical protein